jgi:hypothetical protein
MIAAKALVFKRAGDDPAFDNGLLLDLTDDDGREIEIAATINAGQRVYLKFRLSDLVREVKELRANRKDTK